MLQFTKIIEKVRRMNFLSKPFKGERQPVYASNGVVATSQPLAANAGLEILKKGGNAVDAAIATAATLTVVEPTSNGIGGDAFAIVWMNGKIHGLNSSGPAPTSLTIDAVKSLGHDKMPVHGLVPVTVPGVPAAWAALSKKFGRLPLTDVLAPAIRYAEEGYPISPIAGHFWKLSYNRFKETFKEVYYKEWFNVFSLNDRAPEVGEIWRSPGHAKTLRAIAETNAEDFYCGETAQKIDAFMKEHRGFLSADDLASYKPEWVEPVSVNYRGYDVWEIPPNGHGIVATMALNIFQKTIQAPVWQSAATYHAQLEAMKLAFTDGKAFITEREDMPVDVKYLLSDEYAEKRAALVGEEALQPEAMELPRGGTVYLATADADGNMVSYIQSNYMGFGSGIVIPGTGISLQNRGADFSLDAAAPNALKPGKRTYHTIIPGFLTKDNEAIGPFGVMGGYMQPQGHFQVVSHMIDFGLNPQAALDMPRWQWIGDKTITVEPEFPLYLVSELAARGHKIDYTNDFGSFGRGQIIMRLPNGVYVAGTESRADGQIAAW